MREDASRIRSNPSPFARLRIFAYIVLKANRIDTLAQDRYRAALGGLQRLFKLLVVQHRWTALLKEPLPAPTAATTPSSWPCVQMPAPSTTTLPGPASRRAA